MIADIQRLRDRTSAGVMDCKHALEEAKGDLDAAVRIIEERGLAKVAKRSERATGAGLVESYVHNQRIGVIVEVRAETDFVVRSAPFQELAHELAMQVAAANPNDVAALLKSPHIKDETRTVGDLIGSVIAKVGENITVGKFFRIEL